MACYNKAQACRHEGGPWILLDNKPKDFIATSGNQAHDLNFVPCSLTNSATTQFFYKTVKKYINLVYWSYEYLNQ